MVVRHGKGAVGAARQHRVVCTGARGAAGDEQVGPAVGVDVGDGQVRCPAGGCQRQCGPGFGEQRAGRALHGRRRCRARCGGLALRTHARVLELDQLRARVVGQLGVQVEVTTGRVGLALLAIQLRQGVVGAAQVGIGVQCAPVPVQRGAVVTALLQRLRQEVGRVGIRRIGCQHGVQVLGGAFQFAAAELQQAGAVACLQVSGLFGKQRVETGQCLRLVAVQLAVHLRHGEIEAERALVRISLCKLLEDLQGGGVVVTPHQAHAAIVERDGRGIRNHRLRVLSGALAATQCQQQAAGQQPGSQSMSEGRVHPAGVCRIQQAGACGSRAFTIRAPDVCCAGAWVFLC